VGRWRRVLRQDICCLRIDICCLRIDICCLRIGICCLRIDICCLRIDTCCLRIDTCCLRIDICCLRIDRRWSGIDTPNTRTYLSARLTHARAGLVSPTIAAHPFHGWLVRAIRWAATVGGVWR
jgi:hypothetical protein